ncbi:hypothetical protein AVEN_267328-1 [Araneus ventricosus]|uniref:Uncharacterized protein n=1 Tax=Araneus ventricosus TaxID=182803 RepID=A0A4Y2DMA3_ARAVE|nr:hypothetical protein AVEN_267328-1 [Araneus ventricosus]
MRIKIERQTVKPLKNLLQKLMHIDNFGDKIMPNNADSRAHMHKNKLPDRFAEDRCRPKSTIFVKDRVPIFIRLSLRFAYVYSQTNQTSLHAPATMTFRLFKQ